jgi:hypothetical protein
MAFPCSLGFARRDHHAGSRRHERRVPIRNPRRWPRVQQDCEVRRVPRCRIFDVLECGWKKVRCCQSGWAGDRVGPSVRFLRPESAKSLALTRALFLPLLVHRTHSPNCTLAERRPGRPGTAPIICTGETRANQTRQPHTYRRQRRGHQVDLAAVRARIRLAVEILRGWSSLARREVGESC